MLLFNIEYYKKLSGKYKFAEKNVKGKEYILNTNELIFEGEYLNEQKNGKGKEYYYGIVKFEGEYLNGHRNRKGKEYYDNGNLNFEGDYLTGYKWNGKGYDMKGNI